MTTQYQTDRPGVAFYAFDFDQTYLNGNLNSWGLASLLAGVNSNLAKAISASDVEFVITMLTNDCYQLRVTKNLDAVDRIGEEFFSRRDQGVSVLVACLVALDIIPTTWTSISMMHTLLGNPYHGSNNLSWLLSTTSTIYKKVDGGEIPQAWLVEAAGGNRNYDGVEEIELCPLVFSENGTFVDTWAAFAGGDIHCLINENHALRWEIIAKGLREGEGEPGPKKAKPARPKPALSTTDQVTINLPQLPATEPEKTEQGAAEEPVKPAVPRYGITHTTLDYPMVILPIYSGTGRCAQVVGLYNKPDHLMDVEVNCDFVEMLISFIGKYEGGSMKAGLDIHKAVCRLKETIAKEGPIGPLATIQDAPNSGLMRVNIHINESDSTVKGVCDLAAKVHQGLDVRLVDLPEDLPTTGDTGGLKLATHTAYYVMSAYLHMSARMNEQEGHPWLR